MRRIRVIPVLLLQNGGVVKSLKFKKHRYVGDPINCVKIFNDKEVDEIAIVDIRASRENRPPDLDWIAEICSEAFMPLAYGGGISSMQQIKDILYQGVEKVILNKSALSRPQLLTEAARQFGNQAIVASIDVKKNLFGKYKVYGDCGRKNTGKDPISFAREMEAVGAGEIFLNSIDQDGTNEGYDQVLIRQVANAVGIPVIACGGADSITDFREAVQKGNASAVAAGSMFVFHGPHKAVLINFPKQSTLKKELFSQL